MDEVTRKIYTWDGSRLWNRKDPNKNDWSYLKKWIIFWKFRRQWNWPVFASRFAEHWRNKIRLRVRERRSRQISEKEMSYVSACIVSTLRVYCKKPLLSVEFRRYKKQVVWTFKCLSVKDKISDSFSHSKNNTTSWWKIYFSSVIEPFTVRSIF